MFFANISVKPVGVYPVKLKQARNLRGLTQEQLVAIVNISVRNYQRMEAGEVIPPVNTALRICKALEINPFRIEEWRS